MHTSLSTPECTMNLREKYHNPNINMMHIVRDIHCVEYLVSKEQSITTRKGNKNWMATRLFAVIAHLLLHQKKKKQTLVED